MDRRQALGTLGVALLGALAGCGGETPATATERPTTRTSERPTTATRTATPTPTATPTATPTPTPEPEPVPHELDERFVVDEDGEPFAYTVHGLRTADRLLTTTAAEGRTFVVVDCTVENLGSGEALLPADDIWLRAPDVRKAVGVPTSDAAGEDPRIEHRSLTRRQFTGTPVRGVFAFSDVPLEAGTYRLLFTPPGTTGPISADPTRTHRVPVGTLGGLDRIE